MRKLGVFFLCAVLSAVSLGARAASPLEFERLSLREGLSQSTIDRITQDRKGFLWFVTEDGLNRFDGYRFQVFRSQAGNPNSLSHNELKAIHEDREGILWIGTFEGGLNRYDPSTALFTRFRHDPSDPTSLSANIVRAILEDRTGTLWVGTQGGGLDELDRKTGKFQHHRANPADEGSLPHDDVRALFEDRSGTLWIGTNGGGICRLDREKRVFVKVPVESRSPNLLAENSIATLLEDRAGILWAGTFGTGLLRLERGSGRFLPAPLPGDQNGDLARTSIRALVEDDDGRLWIGTDGMGLLCHDPRDGTLTFARHDPADPASLSTDKVLSLFLDRSKVLWAGTYGGGLNKTDTARKRFFLIRNEVGNPNSLSHNLVWSILEDPDGTIWIGTDSGGLNRWDRKKGTFLHYRHDPRNSASLASDAVRVVYRDAAGVLWLATHGGGLDSLDPATGQITHRRHDPSDPFSLSHDELRAVREDRNGNLWIGTLGGGLERLDRKTGRFTHHRHDPKNPQSISNDFVRAILEDASGTLWIGTQGGGLNRLDPKTGVFQAFRADPGNPESLSNDYVFALHLSRGGDLWVATYGGGVCRLDSKTGRFARFTEKDGLANDAVYGILEDETGRLWLSTNKGLSCFDPKSRTFRNYDVRDGLQSNEFNGGSYFRSKSGEMFFGGINGLNAFYPSRIASNQEPPPVVITDLQLFNRSVAPGETVRGRRVLERPIEYTGRLELGYQESVVTFEFAALHYTAPEKNRYSYRLEGFSDSWILARGDRRSATFTGLAPGDYTFRVKGANADGVWNETGAAIRLRILPPVWRTWWFQLTGIILLWGVTYAAVKRRIQNERARAALKAAHDAQMALLPHEAPKVPGFEIAGLCIPAFEVGGDFFDYIQSDADDGSLTIAVGDVAGKGTRAAMAAALSNGMVNARAGSTEGLGSVLTLLNTTLRRKVQRPMFTALCLASLDSRNRSLEFVNAGLCEPLLKRGRHAEFLTCDGPSFPLGTVAGTEYSSRCLTLAAGDVVVFYTDGVPEARKANGEPWGYEALASFVAGLATEGLAAREIAESIVKEAGRAASGHDQSDDIALVIVKVTG
ncbi:MAG: SpoIIE family protein phosphatase [Acidobacteria bacterium]|nr:SpoIIE family protein phosphatase [Acidobacteriota bacterium]MCG3191737.1 hypothetical protein [Thermoanaerobaculia bacterium]